MVSSDEGNVYVDAAGQQHNGRFTFMLEYTSVLSPWLSAIPKHWNERDAASRRILDIFRSEEINNARRLISQLSDLPSSFHSDFIRQYRDEIIEAAHKVMLAIQRLDDIRPDLKKGHAPRDQARIFEKVEKSVQDLRLVVDQLPDAHWEPTRSETNTIIKDLPKKINNPWGREKKINLDTI